MSKVKAKAQEAAKSQAAARRTDAEIEKWATEQRSLYAAGKLSKWKIKMLEKIPGWSWSEGAA